MLFLSGEVVGYAERPYSFNDERTGDHRSGVSRTLSVSCEGPDGGRRLFEVRLPEEHELSASDREALASFGVHADLWLELRSGRLRVWSMQLAPSSAGSKS